MSIQHSSNGSRFKGRLRHRSWIVSGATFAIMLISGIVLAAWLATGTGNGEARSDVAIDLVISAATPANSLYPGGSADVGLSIENPNPYPVLVTSIVGQGAITSGLSACDTPGNGVSFADQTGQWDVAAGQTLEIQLPGAASMALTSPNDCQGQTFSIPVVATGAAGSSGASTTTTTTVPVPPEPDSDGDGLNDSEELNQYGTDPFNADSDSDGLGDGQEVFTTSTDPLDADTDDDGISDGEEFLISGTAPNNFDTDGDGLGDGLELGLSAGVAGATDLSVFSADADAGATTTDPLNVDTDADGAPDGAEDANQNGAVDGSETDPNDPLSV